MPLTKTQHPSFKHVKHSFKQPHHDFARIIKSIISHQIQGTWYAHIMDAKGKRIGPVLPTVWSNGPSRIQTSNLWFSFFFQNQMPILWTSLTLHKKAMWMEAFYLVWCDIMSKLWRVKNDDVAFKVFGNFYQDIVMFFSLSIWLDFTKFFLISIQKQLVLIFLSSLSCFHSQTSDVANNTQCYL